MAAKYDMPQTWHRKAVTNQIGKLTRQGERHGVEPPAWHELRQLIEEAVRRGQTCEYCGKRWRWRSEGESMPVDSFSIAHSTPLESKGTNHRGNLRVVCAGCNAASRLYPLDEFIRRIRAATPAERDRIHRAGIHRKIVDGYSGERD